MNPVPKGKPNTPKVRRARRRAAMFDVAGDDRERVFERQGWVCFGWKTCPHCEGRVMDPHELIPVSLGGPRESWNRVGLCRTCHRWAQGTVGGIRLLFDWIGKALGQRPNADQPGNVTCRWLSGV